MGEKLFLIIALILSVVFLLNFSSWAVPDTINYQGKLTDANGNALNGEYTVTFRLYRLADSETSIWYETQSMTVTEGIYNVKLGAESPLQADLFDSDELYLEVEIDSEILSPRHRLTSTAFAMRAADADTVGGKYASEFGDGHSLDAANGSAVDAVYVDNNGNVGIGTKNPLQKLSVTGIIESINGGFRFPDGTVQITAMSDSSYDVYLVNSINRLRELTGTIYKKIAVVTGYWKDGDGGGGIFYWDAEESADNDNGGTIIHPDSSGDYGCWRRLYSGPINVKWFGACGETDRTIQPESDDIYIQKTIDTQNIIGGMVYFPAGTYIVANGKETKWDTVTIKYCIRVPSNVTLIFAPEASVFLGNGANSCIFINDGLISKTINTNINILGGTFDLNRNNQSDDLSLCNENAAFFFCGVDNLTIEKAKFKNVKQYALRMFDIENGRFKDLLCTDSQGSGFAMGIPDKTDSQGNVVVARKIKRCIFDNIVANNCDGKMGNAHGNGFILTGDHCQIGTISTDNNAYGIKIQDGSSFVEIGKVHCQNTKSQAFKLQGSELLPVNNISVGQIITNNNWQGTYIYCGEDISISSIVSKFDGTDPNLPAPAVRLGTGKRYNIGSISVSDAGGPGLVLKKDVYDVNIDEIIVRNSGKISNGANIYIGGQGISLGRVISIESNSGNVTKALNIVDTSSEISISSLRIIGNFSVEDLSNLYINSLFISDLVINGNRVGHFAENETSYFVYKPFSIWKTNNTLDRTITNFWKGQVGQEIKVIFGDSFTKVDFRSSYLKGNDGNLWEPIEGDSMRCFYDGTYWYCNICR